MASPDMRLLRQQLNNTCLRALETAAGACINRTHYEITVEHMLAPLLDVGNSDLLCICDHFKLDVSNVRRAINRVLDELKVGNAGRPQFSPFLADWLGEGWQVASLELSLPRIRSGALVLAILRNPNRVYFTDYTDEWGKINEKDLKDKFKEITGSSVENVVPGEKGAAAAPGGGPAIVGEGDALAQFTFDLTEKAKEGKVDPVIGREREIRQCVDILMRRYQNNPMILGEPGTGKTAIAEGLALRIVAGDVPPPLQGITLLGLDVGLLSAGASVKGEFQRRLKAVISEVGARNASGKPVILFIDEAHTLMGGAGSGSSEAANTLKPALARGELRTLACTTFAEYKKNIEKDPPFAQRFGVIRLDEPSVPVCVEMIRGTKYKYEDHHKVQILDDAIRSAVAMSNQYLSDAQLPRKAVSLLDTACARVAVGQSSTPGELEDLRRRIIQLDTAILAIERDAEAGHKIEEAELEKLKTERVEKQAEFERVEALWKEEKEYAEEIFKLRKQLDAAQGEKVSTETEVLPETNPEAVAAAEGEKEAAAPEAEAEKADEAPAPTGDAAGIREQLDAATKKLEGFLGKRAAMVPLQVDSDVVAQILSDWTGIPVGSMVKDQAEAILNFEKNMGARVIGQDECLVEIGKRLRIAGGKLHDPRLPLGVFLLVGPSGVGKTETALAVADMIFGGERFMTTINMTEYSSSMNVSRLIGSAPGLVGFGEGGVLTEAVRQRPYSVVLLDEMEKAHMDVNLLFMQVFDKGALNDSEGRIADFKNTVIIMTSNEGSDMVMDMCADGERPTVPELRKAMQPILEKRFTPAFCGRTTIIPFYPLGPDALRKIVDLKMNSIRKRLMNIYKIKLEMTPAVGDEISNRCQQITIGARLINIIISESVLPQIARVVLENLDTDSKFEKLVMDVKDHEFTYDFK